MKACLLAFSVFAVLACLISLMVTDMHYIDCNELPPVCVTPECMCFQGFSFILTFFPFLQLPGLVDDQYYSRQLRFRH